MKRILLTLITLLVGLNALGGDYVTSMVGKYKGVDGCRTYNVGRGMLKMAMLSMDKEERHFMKKVDKIVVVELDEKCTPSLKKGFKEDLSKLQANGYPLATSENEQGTTSDIYLFGDGKVFTRMIVACYGKNNCIMDIYGSFTEEELKSFKK